MKNKLILIVITGMLTACNNKQEDTNTNSEQEETIKVITPQFKTVDENVAKHIKEVIDNYLLLKDNLVKTDTASTIKLAIMLKNSIEGFDTKLLIAGQKEVYEKNSTAIKIELEGMIKLTNITQQREVFAELTENVYQLAIAFGYSKALYYEHCPMALNDKGATWLSTESEIKNPYFGDEMMSCGSIKEKIK